MTFELRTYNSAEGRMEDLLQRFRDHTVEILERHGMSSIGYWVRASDANTLVYLLQHRGAPKENWAAFAADPDWISARASSVQDGELTTRIESVLLDAVDFSPLQA
ncbi:NIPSNAP family protein [Arthrobacter sp. A5]|uniref:NIPSNAP family protein n=1 Tax=Arthrobacter sp. A5 TaxID=576926 RepID=UPI003DA8E55B